MAAINFNTAPSGVTLNEERRALSFPAHCQESCKRL